MTEEPAGDARRDELAAEIEKAFDGVRRQDGTTLRAARALDDYGARQELLEAKPRDAEGPWQEISGETIEELYDAIAFLDARGFCYYLPAYMVWTLRRGLESDCPASNCVAEELLRPDRQKEAESLTAEQIRATARFLEFVSQRDEAYGQAAVSAGDALERYWGRFLQ